MFYSSYNIHVDIIYIVIYVSIYCYLHSPLQIGAGHFSRVFLAEDQRLGLVAVKVGEGEAGGDTINTEIGRPECWGSIYLPILQITLSYTTAIIMERPSIGAQICTDG